MLFQISKSLYIDLYDIDGGNAGFEHDIFKRASSGFNILKRLFSNVAECDSDLFDKNKDCSNLLTNLFISEPEGDLFEKDNTGCNLLRDLFSETNNNDLLKGTSGGCNVLRSLFTCISSDCDWLETTSEFSVLDFLFISEKPVCNSDDIQKLVQQRPSMTSEDVLVAGNTCKVSFV